MFVVDKVRKLINVSENSNIEINESSIELILQSYCKSFECNDFRDNKCRMRMFLDFIDAAEWEWSQTWATPTKFFMHILVQGDDAKWRILEQFELIKDSWSCLSNTDICDCTFLEQIRLLKNALENAS